MNTAISTNNFLLKLRMLSGEFDAMQIKHGLKALEYDVHVNYNDVVADFYVNGLSTRLLNIKKVNKGLDLSLPAFASAEDWEFLRDWLLVFFSFQNGIAIAENDLIDDIESFFSSGKIESEQKQFAAYLAHLMRNDTPLHFHSIHRDFFAGSKIYERIREQPESEHLTFLYELIRKSQYLALNAHNGAVERIGKTLSSTFCLLDNSGNVVLQPADMIKIQKSPIEDFFISYNSIDKLVFHGCLYLDEKQLFFPKLNDDDWPKFCNQAKEMSINTELFAKYVEGDDEEEFDD